MAAGGRPSSPPTGSARAGACRRHPEAAGAAPPGGPGSPQAAPRDGPAAPSAPAPPAAPLPPRRHVTGAHARRCGAHLQADVSGPRAVPRARLPRLPRCRRARLGPAPAARGGLGLLQPNFPESFLLCLPLLCSPSLSPLSVSRSPLPPNSDDIHMVFCTEEAAQEEGTHPHPNISLFFPPSSSPPLFCWKDKMCRVIASVNWWHPSSCQANPFSKNPFRKAREFYSVGE